MSTSHLKWWLLITSGLQEIRPSIYQASSIPLNHSVYPNLKHERLAWRRVQEFKPNKIIDFQRLQQQNYHPQISSLYFRNCISFQFISEWRSLPSTCDSCQNLVIPVESGGIKFCRQLCQIAIPGTINSGGIELFWNWDRNGTRNWPEWNPAEWN